MKEKIVEPLDIQRKVPYADKFKELADEIADGLHASLQAGDIGDIEAAGRQALAAMLSLYSEGQLPDKQAFAFLKSLSERKTPDPVQKVEQTTQVDMRVMVGALITDNPAALQSALDRAAEARKEIASRLVANAPLSLVGSVAACPTELARSGEADAEGESALQYKEPGEVINIRAGRQPTEEAVDDWAKYRTNS